MPDRSTRRELRNHLARVIRYAAYVLDGETEGDEEARAASNLYDDLIWLIAFAIPGEGVGDAIVKRVAELGRDDFVEFFVKLDQDGETHERELSP